MLGELEEIDELGAQGWFVCFEQAGNAFEAVFAEADEEKSARGQGEDEGGENGGEEEALGRVKMEDDIEDKEKEDKAEEVFERAQEKALGLFFLAKAARRLEAVKE